MLIFPTLRSTFELGLSSSSHSHPLIICRSPQEAAVAALHAVCSAYYTADQTTLRWAQGQSACNQFSAVDLVTACAFLRQVGWCLSFWPQ